MSRPLSTSAGRAEPVMTISVRRLKAFVAVVQMRRVDAAAKQLHVTKSAVSKGVRELERSLGVKLLQPTSSGMQLTRFGEVFYIHANLALTEIHRAQNAISELKGAGRVIVGAMSDVLDPILPTAVARLLGKRQGLSVNFSGGHFDQLVTDARTGGVDFFLAAVPRDGIPEDLEVETLYQDELSFIVRPGHPLASRRTVALKDVCGRRWISPTGSSFLNELIRRSFEEAGLEYSQNSLEVPQLGAMRSVLRESDFVAAVTRMRVREELETGLLVALPIRMAATRHPVGVFRLANHALSKSAEELLSLVRLVAKEYAR
jgi:DNA-binding transcriptional LysR family regulator